MEVGRNNILADSYEIWQGHFGRTIPKGQIQAGVKKGEEQKKLIIVTLTPLVVAFYLGVFIQSPPGDGQNFGVVHELQYNDSSGDTSLIWILFPKYYPVAFASFLR